MKASTKIVNLNTNYGTKHNYGLSSKQANTAFGQLKINDINPNNSFLEPDNIKGVEKLLTELRSFIANKTDDIVTDPHRIISIGDFTYRHNPNSSLSNGDKTIWSRVDSLVSPEVCPKVFEEKGIKEPVNVPSSLIDLTDGNGQFRRLEDVYEKLKAKYEEIKNYKDDFFKSHIQDEEKKQDKQSTLFK